MKKISTQIIFFGNGPVASASLNGLITIFGAEAIGMVVTKRRPAHHKDPAPVEVLSNEHGLSLSFADSRSELDTLIAKTAPASTLGIVVDFGVIIGQQTIDYFPHGIINGHFSLLPEWRGADPISFSILSGQAKTGVSLMLIDAGLDTGDILAIQELDISDYETTTSLTAKLIQLSTEMLAETIPSYLDGNVVPAPQDDFVITYSPKLSKNNSRLDFTKPAAVLGREVRAFNAWPKSKSTIGGIEVVVTIAKASAQKLPIGDYEVTTENTILIGCRVGCLEILELKPAGKQAMKTAAFLNGYGSRLNK